MVLDNELLLLRILKEKERKKSVRSVRIQFFIYDWRAKYV